MSHYLFRILALPLAGISIACFLAAGYAPSPWRDLLINLSAGFVGSVVTVFYIDYVIARQKRIEWRTVRATTVNRVRHAANTSITSVRIALAVDADELNVGAAVSDNIAISSRETIRVAQDVLQPKVPALSELDEKGWRTFAANLQGVSSAVSELLSLFGHHLSPATTRHLLDLQDTASNITRWYMTFPDVFGVPVHRLTPLKNGASAESNQRQLNDQMKAWVNQLLDQSSDLLTCLVKE